MAIDQGSTLLLGFGTSNNGQSLSSQPLAPTISSDGWQPSGPTSLPERSIIKVLSSPSQGLTTDDRVISTSSFTSTGNNGQAFSSPLLPNFSSSGKVLGPTIVSQSLSGAAIGSQSFSSDFNQQLRPQEYSTRQQSMQTSEMCRGGSDQTRLIVKNFGKSPCRLGQRPFPIVRAMCGKFLGVLGSFLRKFRGFSGFSKIFRVQSQSSTGFGLI